MSDPAIFAQMVVDAIGVASDKTPTILQNFRLLPSRARFKTQIDRWAQSAMQK